MLNLKRLMIVIITLAIGLGVAHAVANSQADKVARQFVEDLVQQLNEAGLQVSVGEVSANPYNKAILVKTVNIIDTAGYRHSIETVTLKNIELNATQDFIEAMHIEARDASINVLSPAINPEPGTLLREHLQALNIDGGQVGHHQTLSYLYDVENAQLKVDSKSEFFHPDNRAEPLFDLAVKKQLSRVPDLKQQFEEMNNPAMQQALAASWLDVSLNEVQLRLQDQGAWQPIVRSGAKQAGLSEEAYRARLKQQWTASLATLKILPQNVQAQIQSAVQQFVDSEQPELSLEINSTLPDGSGLMLALMTAMLNPVAINNFFVIALEAH